MSSPVGLFVPPRRLAVQFVGARRQLRRARAALANRFADFASDVHRAHQVDKEWLHGLVDRLAQKNSSAMIETVAPVGDSVKTLTLAKQKPAEFIIDEPIADTIRAMGNLDVQDAVEMVVRLTAVDTVSRTVKITSAQHPKSIRAKIIDPALMLPQNAYTRALDNHTPVRITAKPVLKDGELYMYYISDAKAAEE